MISYQWHQRSKNHEKNGVQKVIKNAPNRPKLQESTPFDERDRLRTILTFITQATPAIFHPFCPFLVLFCGQPISRKSSFCCSHTDICPMGVSFHLARGVVGHLRQKLINSGGTFLKIRQKLSPLPAHWKRKLRWKRKMQWKTAL